MKQATPKILKNSIGMKAIKPVGFIGQGFVGKSYADDFERRELQVIRYSLEEPYRRNRDRLKECGIVFIAVPTPTTPRGFDVSIVEASLKLLVSGTIVVIKSTLLPGTTKVLQKKFPSITILFSPEFLNAATAARDAANPFANIIGIPERTKTHVRAAGEVHRLLPRAPFSLTCASDEAEIYKYAHNVAGYMQVLTYNLLYDVAKKRRADWKNIQKALEADPMVSNWYIRPVHKSGRGAGGPCFIKDFAAFSRLYGKLVSDREGMALLRSAEIKNISLLLESKKDLGLLRGVYGDAPKKKGRR